MSLVISDSFPVNARQLRSCCTVIDPVSSASCTAQAIWDTGASATCISKAIAAKLNLPVTGVTSSLTAGGVTPSNTHVVNVKIGNVCFLKIPVSAPAGLPDDTVLIGMDIIGNGKFTLENQLVNGAHQKILTLEIL